MRYLLIFTLGCGSAELAPSAINQTESALCQMPLNSDWQWQKQGVVAGIPEGVLSPSLVNVEGVLHAFFAKKTGLQHRIWHAQSKDGVTFEGAQMVEGLGDSPVIAYPNVQYNNGTFDLLFGSGSFSTALSTDGVHFNIDKERVMTASYDASRFDTYSLLYPSRVGDVLFFSAFDGQRVRIGRAVSFVVTPTVPVLDVSNDDFDNSAVAQPHVRKLFGRWLMWYGGYDTSVTNPGPYRIGFADSDDGISWKKHGVVLSNTIPTDAWSARDPALVEQAGKWSMFYVGMGNDGVYRLHRASSGVCALPH